MSIYGFLGNGQTGRLVNVISDDMTFSLITRMIEEEIEYTILQSWQQDWELFGTSGKKILQRIMVG